MPPGFTLLDAVYPSLSVVVLYSRTTYIGAGRCQVELPLGSVYEVGGRTGCRSLCDKRQTALVSTVLRYVVVGAIYGCRGISSNL